MGKRHERTAARRAALQVLYSGEINETSPVQIIDDELVLVGDDEVMVDKDELSKYGDMLVRGVEEHADEIDALLKETSENWTLDRMPIVDLCVLRLAVFEMKYVDVVPISVSINEAVDLAKAFGGEDESGHFVNGMLGRIARSLKGESVDGEPDDDDACEGESDEARPVDDEIVEGGQGVDEEPAQEDVSAQGNTESLD